MKLFFFFLVIIGLTLDIFASPTTRFRKRKVRQFYPPSYDALINPDPEPDINEQPIDDSFKNVDSLASADSNYDAISYSSPGPAETGTDTVDTKEVDYSVAAFFSSDNNGTPPTAASTDTSIDDEDVFNSAPGTVPINIADTEPIIDFDDTTDSDINDNLAAFFADSNSNIKLTPNLIDDTVNTNEEEVFDIFPSAAPIDKDAAVPALDFDDTTGLEENENLTEFFMDNKRKIEHVSTSTDSVSIAEKGTLNGFSKASPIKAAIAESILNFNSDIEENANAGANADGNDDMVLFFKSNTDNNKPESALVDADINVSEENMFDSLPSAAAITNAIAEPITDFDDITDTNDDFPIFQMNDGIDNQARIVLPANTAVASPFITLQQASTVTAVSIDSESDVDFMNKYDRIDFSTQENSGSNTNPTLPVNILVPATTIAGVKPAATMADSAPSSISLEITKTVEGKTTCFSELFVYGGSFGETGNALALTNNKFPSSSLYKNGRFSNGPIWAEYVAGTLKTPLTSFAYGGATVSNAIVLSSITDFNVTVPSVYDQVLLSMVSNPPRDSPDRLYALAIGENDLINSNFEMDTVNNVINQIRTIITLLAGAGAQNVLVFGLMPFVKTPSGTSKEENEIGEITSKFNSDLKDLVQMEEQNIQAINPVFQTFFVDLTSILESEITDENSEFTEKKVPCVNPITLKTCSSPNSHVFWDDRHPTSRFHRTIAKRTMHEILLIEDFVDYNVQCADKAKIEVCFTAPSLLVMKKQPQLKSCLNTCLAD